MQEQAGKCSVNQPWLRDTQWCSNLTITPQQVQINTLSETKQKLKGQKKTVVGELWYGM